jgi:hypothetical protein
LGGKVTSVGLGTLYTAFAGKQSGVPHFSEMQTLAWLAKENRPPEQRKTGLVEHKFHPREARVLRTPDDARLYAAEIYEFNWSVYMQVIGVDPARVCFVPLPASSTTRTTSLSERWPARSFAVQLVSRGLGTMDACLVNKQPRAEQTSQGSRIPAHEICANTEVLSRPAADRHIVFVDDVITWGSRIAASHRALSWSGVAGAICIAFTNDHKAQAPEDCYQPKARVISYDASSTPWTVDIAEPASI